MQDILGQHFRTTENHTRCSGSMPLVVRLVSPSRGCVEVATRKSCLFKVFHQLLSTVAAVAVLRLISLLPWLLRSPSVCCFVAV